MDSQSLWVGQTLLGKWRLDALLGEGGMGSVYSATHRNGRRAAVKMLRSSKPAEVMRFRREGYIANLVDHPGVVRVLDDDVAEDGTPFLVMELLEGATMDALARRRGGRLAVNEVLDIVRDVLDVLAAAHDRGIVHRDIKPENLFVTSDGRVKVLDFGIAHMPEASGLPSASTRPGMLMGTLSFMAPEQARARWELVGPAANLWGVGATMFTALSGQLVHLAETTPELLTAIITRPARSLGEVMQVEPTVAALVDRALELNIAARWGSAREMRQALIGVQASIREVDRQTTTSNDRMCVPAQRRWKTSKGSAALGALDVSSAVLALMLTIHGLDARASQPTRDAVGSVDAGVVALPASPASVVPAPTAASRDEALARSPVVSRDVTCPVEHRSPFKTPAGAAPARHRDLYDHRY